MDSLDPTKRMIALVSTGFTLGLVHVLAGPDHLSALAALAVGTSWRAFMLGVRWGIGHSTGLVVVAIVFISMKGDLDLRTLGRYCDSIVGIFMIGLGCYGVVGALKMYREKKAKRDPDWESVDRFPSPGMNVATPAINKSHHINSGSDLSSEGGGATSTIDRLSPMHRKSELDDDHRNISVGLDLDKLSAEKSDIETARTSTNKHSHYHDHDHDHVSLSEACPLLPFVDMHDPTTQRVISFSIGLLHGVAGPGGILGVLPAVEMQNWRYSFIYLGSFILASTLSMGTFAALYGEVTKRLGATAESVELALSVFSAAMSIIVGTIWLVLSLLGKLEGLFH